MDNRIVKIICADDEEIIHNGLVRMVSELNKANSFFKLIIDGHFYSTDELKDFLQTDNKSDLLLLDIDFKGGESGIEALEVIRVIEPHLKITLLSALDDIDLIVPASRNYDVKYLKKPISSNELLIHINEISEQQEKFEKLESDLLLYQNWIDQVENDSEQAMPTGLSDIIARMFNSISFTASALKDLLVSNDYRIYNVLKFIDLKIPVSNGMNPKHISTKIRNYDRIVEYRFSQKGRIFISFQDTKPVVVCIDPFHRIFT